jgi:UDP-N-acetylglucosamine acyltransferase
VVAVNYIHPTAVIYPNVVLGDNNWIGAYCVIGGPPEHRNHDPRQWDYSVMIGDNNRFHEHVVIQSGTQQHTVVEDGVMLMHGVHVAHDCLVSSGVTMSPLVALAGHVEVGVGATVGMGATVHQRLLIGSGAMVGMGSVVTKNVPANEKWYGNPARSHGLNARHVGNVFGTSPGIRINTEDPAWRFH